MTWRLAWRNLWRHRGRTWILVSVISLTYALALLGISIGDDSHQRMLDEALRAAGGDVLIHGDGYWDGRSSDITIRSGMGLTGLVEEMEGVATVYPRVLINGLASTSAASRPIFLQGVEPGSEVAFRGLASDVEMGSLALDERSDPLVLGADLARELEVELGDRVVLTASGPDGELVRALFHLTGTVDSGAGPIDEIIGYTTIPAAQEALGMGDDLTQIGLVLRPGADLEETAARVRVALSGYEVPLEVLTWRDAVPEMVGFVELDDAFGYIYMAVIFVVVLFAITNTFLMAVMERVREFGLLAALGLKGRRVGEMLLAETLVLTGLAMMVGLGLGLVGHFAVDYWGISVAMYGIEEIEISGIDMADMVIRSSISPRKWLAASLLVGLASMASALYPAWRATRLAPSEAMRFYE